MIGGAFWTPSAMILGGTSKTFDQLIKSLFANSEQGFAYDPNDLTTMFQDAAGTVPVTGVGQAVGLILDKSGRGNHASQNDSASRPILRQNAVTGAYYLEFDGSDDFLVTNSIDFTATNKISLFAGVRKLSDIAQSVVVELSQNWSTNNGSFSIQAPNLAGQQKYAFTTRASNSIIFDVVGYTAPNSAVISVRNDVIADRIYMKINGSLFSNLVDQGTGNYGNYPLYIGRRGGVSLPFSGHLYSLIGIGRLTTDAETIALEKSIAKNTGVTL